MTSQYRGPYAFVNGFVAIRETAVDGGDVTINIRSNHWPVTVDWGDEGEPEVIAEADGGAVEHSYASSDTYSIVATSAHGGSDTIDVTVTVE